jgi:hypothetical protein
VPGAHDGVEVQQAPGAVGHGDIDEFTVRQLDRVAADGGDPGGHDRE